MKLGQQTAMDIESISTGSLSLDLALGIGGLPRGRVSRSLWTRVIWKNNAGITS